MEKDRRNIEIVKEKTDIVNVVQKYVQLKNAGKNYSGLCPFHSEKTPSFNVSPELQIYKCFGCGKSGDVISFIQEIERIDFHQALQKLASDAGIKLEDTSKPQPIAITLHQWAQKYYQKVLFSKQGEVALKYLKNRGIDEDLIKKFGIGFAPGDGAFLKKLNNYKKVHNTLLIKSGLFVEKSGQVKEKFNKRVVFPILNNSGKTIAFTGRKLIDDNFGPKYLNTAESEIYKKRETLYGFYQAKASIKKEDLAIILEGTTDVIALHKAGYKNAIAPLGTGLTIQQLQLIKNYTENVLFIFDNDSAGQNALERAFRLSLELDINPFASITEGFKDIDELIQKEPKKLKDLIKNPKDAFSFLLLSKLDSKERRTLKDLNELNTYLKSVVNSVSDETKKSFYIETAKNIIPELKIGGSITSREEAVKHQGKDTNRSSHEVLYLKTIFNIQNYNPPEWLTPEYFSNEYESEIFKQLLISKPLDRKTFVNNLSKETREYFETVILKNTEEVDPQSSERRIQNNYLERTLRNVRILLAVAEEKEDTQSVKELTERVLEISTKLSKLKNENIKL